MRRDVVHDAWTAGHHAWPEIRLSRQQFDQFVAVRDSDALARFPADLYLAAACMHRDPAALSVFDREILMPARGAITAIDSNDAFIDEVFQRLRIRLLVGDSGQPHIADYLGHGPLRAWIGISAARAALMLRRSQQRQRELSVNDWTDALVMTAPSTPELDLLKQRYKGEFSAALQAAAAALEPRLRSVLRMSFVDGLSIDEIGAVYAVHRATAARWIHRACSALSAQTRVIVAERLALSPTELEQVTALIQSQLSLRLSQLLPEALLE